MPKKMKPIKFSLTLRYKETVESQPEDLMLINKEKKELIIEWILPTDFWVKMKEIKKVDKYLDLAWELKNFGNMKVTVIPIVVGA